MPNRISHLADLNSPLSDVSPLQLIGGRATSELTTDTEKVEQKVNSLYGGKKKSKTKKSEKPNKL